MAMSKTSGQGERTGPDDSPERWLAALEPRSPGSREEANSPETVVTLVGSERMTPHYRCRYIWIYLIGLDTFF